MPHLIKYLAYSSMEPGRGCEEEEEELLVVVREEEEELLLLVRVAGLRVVLFGIRAALLRMMRFLPLPKVGPSAGGRAMPIQEELC
jgi:hypothetical protein